MTDAPDQLPTKSHPSPLREAIRFSLSGSSLRFRRRLGVLTLGLTAVGLLDAVAVVLLGSATAWLLASSSGQPLPSTPVDLGPLDPSRWEGNPTKAAVLLAIAGITLLLLRTVLSTIGTRTLVTTAYRHALNFSVQSWRRVLAQPELVLGTSNTNLLAYSVNYGATLATAGVVTPTVLLVADSFLILVLGVLIMILSPLSGIISLAVFGAAGLIFLKWIGPRSDEAAKSAALGGVKVETVTRDGANLYKEAWAIESVGWLEARYSDAQSVNNAAQRRVAFYTLLPRYVAELVLIISLASVGAIVALTSDGVTAAALFVAYSAAASRLLPAVVRLQSSLIQIRLNASQGEPTRDLMSQLAQFEARASATTGPRTDAFQLQGHVLPSIQSATFAYPGQSTPTLRDVTLSLKPREFVAVVGPSGSGKSTLVNVLLGLLSPQIGSANPARRSPDESDLGGVAYVPQDVWILYGSLRENVGLGRQVSDDHILEALDRCGLTPLLGESGLTLDSILDERGNSLSGGQKQRLGLARALLGRPDLLVLDEATSGLDAQSERDIVNELQRLKGTCGLLVIAHRLQTVLQADRVVYLEGGRILAEGSFDEVRGQVPDFAQQAHLGGVAQ